MFAAERLQALRALARDTLLPSRMHEPTLADLYAARPRVARLVRPTPLIRHPLLAEETGLDVLVKHENHNPTGAFKVRGGAEPDCQPACGGTPRRHHRDHR